MSDYADVQGEWEPAEWPEPESAEPWEPVVPDELYDRDDEEGEDE
jgi:hypothetical protein